MKRKVYYHSSQMGLSFITEEELELLAIKSVISNRTEPYSEFKLHTETQPELLNSQSKNVKDSIVEMLSFLPSREEKKFSSG